MLKSYRLMYDAYARIFTRLGLEFRAVAADTGQIGGSASHEFQVLAESGEDAIAWCPGSDYAANVELAEAVAPHAHRAAPAEPMQKVATPGLSTCEQVAQLLHLPLGRTVKCIMLNAGGKVHMLLIRGDHSLNEVKVGKARRASRAFAGPATPRSSPPPVARPVISGRSASLPTCR